MIGWVPPAFRIVHPAAETSRHENMRYKQRDRHEFDPIVPIRRRNINLYSEFNDPAKFADIDETVTIRPVGKVTQPKSPCLTRAQ